MNLYQSILRHLDDDSSILLGESLGEKQSKIEQGIFVSVPMILRALSGVAQTKQGCQTILTTLGTANSTLLYDFNTYLTKPNNLAISTTGMSQLDQVLLAKSEKLVQQVSQKSGLDYSNAGKLVGTVSALTIATAATKLGGHRADQNEVAHLFGSQLPYLPDVNAVMPIRERKWSSDERNEGSESLQLSKHNVIAGFSTNPASVTPARTSISEETAVARKGFPVGEKQASKRFGGSEEQEPVEPKIEEPATARNDYSVVDQPSPNHFVVSDKQPASPAIEDPTVVRNDASVEQPAPIQYVTEDKNELPNVSFREATSQATKKIGSDDQALAKGQVPGYKTSKPSLAPNLKTDATRPLDENSSLEGRPIQIRAKQQIDDSNKLESEKKTEASTAADIRSRIHGGKNQIGDSVTQGIDLVRSTLGVPKIREKQNSDNRWIKIPIGILACVACVFVAKFIYKALPASEKPKNTAAVQPADLSQNSELVSAPLGAQFGRGMKEKINELRMKKMNRPVEVSPMSEKPDMKVHPESVATFEKATTKRKEGAESNPVASTRIQDVEKPKVQRTAKVPLPVTYQSNTDQPTIADKALNPKELVPDEQAVPIGRPDDRDSDNSDSGIVKMDDNASDSEISKAEEPPAVDMNTSSAKANGLSSATKPDVKTGFNSAAKPTRTKTAKPGEISKLVLPNGKYEDLTADKRAGILLFEIVNLANKMESVADAKRIRHEMQHHVWRLERLKKQRASWPSNVQSVFDRRLDTIAAEFDQRFSGTLSRPDLVKVAGPVFERFKRVLESE